MPTADPAPRKGLSEREYARHAGLSRGAVQKARSSGRLVLHPDGSIDAVGLGRAPGAGDRSGETAQPSATARLPAGAGGGGRGGRRDAEGAGADGAARD